MSTLIMNDISVNIDGKEYKASYEIEAGVMTVFCGPYQKKGTPNQHNYESFAKILLRDLISENDL